MINSVEAMMSKALKKGTQRETEWRNYFARFAASGQTITAFCRSEAISEGNFYFWRKRLETNASNAATTPPAAPAAFIDMGSMRCTETHRATEQVERTNQSPNIPMSGIEVRIDLGGIVLTITRH